jgi:cysteine desulfurase
MLYLDHAATTRLDPAVLEAMLPWLTVGYGNASSLYGLGKQSRAAVEGAREQVAAALGARAKEVVFTSGGSEADNLAIRGAAWARRDRGRHILTTPVEHEAVLQTCHALEAQGFTLGLLPVDRTGRVAPEAVREALTEETVLVSVMHANNEIGTVEPIAEIGALCRERGVLFHTDAVQSVGYLPVNVRALNVDLLSLSAHKIYGPKGVGALYVRSGVRLAPQVTGGDQEFNRRAGTENVPGIVGLGAAIERVMAVRETEFARVAALRDRLITGVLSRCEEAELTGHPTERLPNHASFLFHFIEGESLLLNLDIAGIAGSSGSACATGDIEPSHVLLALGYTPVQARGALRLTLGRENTAADVDRVLEILPPLVRELQAMHPGFRAGRTTGDTTS